MERSFLRRDHEARESEWEGKLEKEAENRKRVEQVAKQLRISLNDITEQCDALRTFFLFRVMFSSLFTHTHTHRVACAKYEKT